MTIEPSEVRSLLRYEPDTGKLYWLERGVSLFRGKYPAQRSCRSWNARNAGKEAFTAVGASGYREGRIHNRIYRAHRVIWAIAHGEWPEQVDHINGDRADNRLVNLRAVTRFQNARNTKLPITNTSGVMGVERHVGGTRWRARIKVNRRQIHLGYFVELSDAIAARKAAEKKYGFHANHGRADPVGRDGVIEGRG